MNHDLRRKGIPSDSARSKNDLGNIAYGGAKRKPKLDMNFSLASHRGQIR